MEYVILGLLLIKPMTAYEISAFVRKNLALICSASAGSVQTALRKLLKSESVTQEEFVENSINKKVYSITALGKLAFFSWIKTPMQTSKVKNMELSKLFFLGFADKDEQSLAIEDYIAQLCHTLDTLANIKKSFTSLAEQQRKFENSNCDELLKFQEYTVDYGIATAEFEISWYNELLKKMEDNR